MGAEVVLDCSEDDATRHVVNGACCAQGVPLVEAAVAGFEGLVMSIRPGESACYRCAFPQPTPAASRRSPQEAGVLGAMAGIVGSLQALEGLKLLGGVGEPLLGRILRIDGRDMSQTVVTAGRLPGCPACAPE
jgi:adenylyltransferase/sulfurtransferase